MLLLLLLAAAALCSAEPARRRVLLNVSTFKHSPGLLVAQTATDHVTQSWKGDRSPSTHALSFLEHLDVNSVPGTHRQAR